MASFSACLSCLPPVPCQKKVLSVFLACGILWALVIFTLAMEELLKIISNYISMQFRECVADPSAGMLYGTRLAPPRQLLQRGKQRSSAQHRRIVGRLPGWRRSLRPRRLCTRQPPLRRRLRYSASLRQRSSWRLCARRTRQPRRKARLRYSALPRRMQASLLGCSRRWPRCVWRMPQPPRRRKRP